jgi:pimeloyl-ACP methyl ester carboxylesterase
MRAPVALVACALMATLAYADGAGGAGGAKLETLELGSGPTVVLVPSLGGTRTDWLPTVKRLREQFHCVMVEIPGQGKSPLPDPFSLPAAAEALDAVVARQSGDSTVIVGSGIGGLLALMAASAHPEHQRGVMLIDAPIKSPLPVPDQERDQLMRFMDEHYDQFMQMAYSHAGRDSTENAHIYTMMAAVPPATMKSYFRHLLGVDANRDLRALKSPPALVFTDRTWKAGQTWGAISKAFGYEDSTVAVPVRVANAGMLVMKDQPDTLAALISRFARRSFAARR